MAAGTIIDIKAGMEYDNAPTLSITTFFMLWRFTRLHQFRVALRVKVFFFIIRAVRSDSRSPFCYVGAASKHRLLGGCCIMLLEKNCKLTTKKLEKSCKQAVQRLEKSCNCYAET